MPRHFPDGKFFRDCVQVIRHNRNRGIPQRRGQIPKGRHNYYQMISTEQFKKNNPLRQNRRCMTVQCFKTVPDLKII
jgi:hypothetical protein